jgi:hypothetical protein
MALEVNTFPATITENMDVQLMFMIKTANSHILQIAESLRKSPINDLDPNDGRKAIINISVSFETGSIIFDRQFIFTKAH